MQPKFIASISISTSKCKRIKTSSANIYLPIVDRHIASGQTHQKVLTSKIIFKKTGGGGSILPVHITSNSLLFSFLSLQFVHAPEKVRGPHLIQFFIH